MPHEDGASPWVFCHLLRHQICDLTRRVKGAAGFSIWCGAFLTPAISEDMLLLTITCIHESISAEAVEPNKNTAAS